MVVAGISCWYRSGITNGDKQCFALGGAVAERSKALLFERENKRKPQKIPGLPPDLGNLYKKQCFGSTETVSSI